MSRNASPPKTSTMTPKIHENDKLKAPKPQTSHHVKKKHSSVVAIPKSYSALRSRGVSPKSSASKNSLSDKKSQSNAFAPSFRLQPFIDQRRSRLSTERTPSQIEVNMNEDLSLIKSQNHGSAERTPNQQPSDQAVNVEVIIQDQKAEKDDHSRQDCMRNFLENDVKHLEREINECNTRYSQLIQTRDQLVHASCGDTLTQAQVNEQQQWISEKIS